MLMFPVCEKCISDLNLLQSQILLDGVRAHSHHLILDTDEVANSLGFSFWPSGKVAVDGAAELHPEVGVGKRDDLVQTFDQTSTND